MHRISKHDSNRAEACDPQRYFAMIADAADRAFAEGATSVAFAQASMALAADICVKGTPITSPHASLLAAAAG